MSSYTLCREPSERFSKGNGTVTSRFLESGKEIASAEERQDCDGSFTSSEEVDEACEGGKEGICAIRQNGFLDVSRSFTRGAAGRERMKGL